MIDHSFLRCPYCMEGFVKIDFKSASILKCSCYEYPLIYGIPIIIKRDDVSYASRLVRKNMADEAASLQMEVSLSFFHRAINKMKKIRIPFIAFLNHFKNNIIIMLKRKRASNILSLLKAKRFVALVDYLEAKDWGRYITYRFFSESYLVGEQIILNNFRKGEDSKNKKKNSKELVVIDHMCGTGHYTFLLGNVFNGKIYATDQSFLNLMIAKHCLNPKAEYVCLDGNKPMPFRDNTADFFFNSDSFHYLKGKREQKLCIEDVGRILKEDGRILFAHLHIKGGNNMGEGNAHSEQDYSRMFSAFNKRIIDEGDVLRKLYKRQMDGKSIAVLGSMGKKVRFIMNKRFDIKNPLKDEIERSLNITGKIFKD